LTAIISLAPYSYWPPLLRVVFDRTTVTESLTTSHLAADQEKPEAFAEFCR
jgi:hypothetical protein